MVDQSDVEDVIQESYCRLSALNDVSHIQSGRAYFFQTARRIVLDQMRRSKIVRIEAVSEIDALNVVLDEPSPERIASGRRELARVQGFIAALPDRCRRIFEMRKIHGYSQKEIAAELGVSETIVENDVSLGLRLILRAVAEEDGAPHESVRNKQERRRNARIRKDD